MPLENDLDKVLIIGSGPTLIGSVAEMDLMATEAIDALTEEGIQVVLVNPNPATISTDKRPDVTVYLEPMTLDFSKRILRMEEPDAIIRQLIDKCQPWVIENNARLELQVNVR